MRPVPKKIRRPDIPGARRLSPLETNAIKLSTHRTLLTAEYLEKLRRDGARTSPEGADAPSGEAQVR